MRFDQRYRLERVIGRGAHGVVMTARDLSTGGIVAVKKVRRDDSGDRRRLLTEAEALSRLDHPNIVAHHGLFAAARELYLVMDYVEGGSLAERLPLRTPGGAAALRIARGVAEGLVFAHQRGLLHGDLKPANILLDREGRPKIADFGLARRLRADSRRVETSDRLEGTASYLAPEILNGAPFDARADIFAFGAVLYEMTTGVRAFSGETHGAIVDRVLNHPAEPLVASDAGMPSVLAPLIEAALRKDPDRRLTSMTLAVSLIDAMTPMLRVERGGERSRSAPRIVGRGSMP